MEKGLFKQINTAITGDFAYHILSWKDRQDQLLIEALTHVHTLAWEIKQTDDVNGNVYYLGTVNEQMKRVLLDAVQLMVYDLELGDFRSANHREGIVEIMRRHTMPNASIRYDAIDRLIHVVMQLAKQSSHSKGIPCCCYFNVFPINKHIELLLDEVMLQRYLAENPELQCAYAETCKKIEYVYCDL